MKWLIASDLHGDAATCEQLFEAYTKEGAERLLFLGDLLYHGPRNDLPGGYAPKKVITLLNERKEEIFCVRGNCDTEVDQMVLEFPILADYMLLPLGEKMVFATHGHKFNKDHLPLLKKGDILLHGHTHVPTWEEKDGIYILNPGSVTIPKAGSEKSYMTLKDGVFCWKTLDGKEYRTLEITK
ncbi:MAG: phosphodiesterase [Clostridia bacterium]|nr:phosphodiesterase [Clostridia bacterium]